MLSHHLNTTSFGQKMRLPTSKSPKMQFQKLYKQTQTRLFWNQILLLDLNPTSFISWLNVLLVVRLHIKTWSQMMVISNILQSTLTILLMLCNLHFYKAKKVHFLSMEIKIWIWLRLETFWKSKLAKLKEAQKVQCCHHLTTFSISSLEQLPI